MAEKVRIRKTKGKIELEHRAYGPCILIEHRATASGTDVLDARFPDKTVRTLLADSTFWVTPEMQLKAIPITVPAKTKDVHEDEPEVHAAEVAAD